MRLGTISWECEEPHNAQTDLEFSAEYYFSGYVQTVIDMVGSDAEHDDPEEGEKHFVLVLVLLFVLVFIRAFALVFVK